MKLSDEQRHIISMALDREAADINERATFFRSIATGQEFSEQLEAEIDARSILASLIRTADRVTIEHDEEGAE